MTNPVLAKSKNFLAQPGAGFQQGFEPPTEQPTYNAEYPYTQQFQTYTQPPNYAEGQPEGLGYPYSDAQPYPAGGFQEYVPEQTWEAPETPVIQKVMTLDDVLTKTALTLGLTIVVAIGSVTLAIAMGMDITLLMGAGLVCGLATIIFPFIAASRRKIGAGLAIAFSILEGVFIGSISLIFEMVYPGIVLQAVMATFVAAALVLVAFKFGKFRLSSKVRKIVMMSMMAYVGVALTNLILYFFGINLGLFPGPYGPVSGWAWLAAGIGVVLAVLSLVDDFQFVEQGIANRLPASESWRAAYGLTVTLVWLYVNLLRILSYIRR